MTLRALSAGIFIAVAAGGQALAGAGIEVEMNQAKIVRLSKSADTIIVGNPAIADASVQDASTIVLTGKGQPLDVGRATRAIPDGLLRRAVAARDRGCAHPGCGRPVSWTHCHHIVPWELGGETKLSNLVMLCAAHHRQIHSTEWVVRIRDGLPEFIPPKWLDFEQKPRRRALPHLAGAR